MTKIDDISRLVDRFLDGDTSVAEERRLDEFFLAHEHCLSDLPEHLQIAAEMFREFRAMKAPVAAPIKKRPSQWLKWVGGIAAAACLVLAFILYKPSAPADFTQEDPQQMAETSDTIKVLYITAPAQPIAEAKPETVKTKQKAAKGQAPEPSTVDHGKSEEKAPVTPPSDAGSAMLCTFTPSANRLPMQSDGMTRTVMMECEMSLLEEEFQISERRRQVIEI